MDTINLCVSVNSPVLRFMLCINICHMTEKRMEKRMVVAGISIKPVMCCVFVGHRLVKNCGPKPQDLCTPCEPKRYTVSPREPMCQPCTQCVGMLTDPTVHKHFATSWSLRNCLTFYLSPYVEVFKSLWKNVHPHRTQRVAVKKDSYVATNTVPTASINATKARSLQLIVRTLKARARTH